MRAIIASLAIHHSIKGQAKGCLLSLPNSWLPRRLQHLPSPSHSLTAAAALAVVTAAASADASASHAGEPSGLESSRKRISCMCARRFKNWLQARTSHFRQTYRTRQTDGHLDRQTDKHRYSPTQTDTQEPSWEIVLLIHKLQCRHAKCSKTSRGTEEVKV